jgi:4'-phosphopantetheinyl transferase
MPPDPQSLPPGTIDVWRISISSQTPRLAVWESYLSVDERERAGRFRFPQHRAQAIVSRGSLRYLLAEYRNTDPVRIAFQVNPYGKLASADSTCDLRFNTSHSGDWVVHGFVRGDEIGIDIEAVRTPIDWEPVARTSFSAREVDAILKLPEARRRDGFFACWSRKEAFIKALGQGLHTPLDAFSVTVDPDAEVVTLDDHGGVGRGTPWQFTRLSIAPELFGCVVVAGQPRSVRMRERCWPE